MKKLLCLSALIIYIFACCASSATKPSTISDEPAAVQPSAMPSPELVVSYKRGE